VVFPGTFLSTVLGCGKGAEATEWRSSKAPPTIAATSIATTVSVMSIGLGMQGEAFHTTKVSVGGNYLAGTSLMTRLLTHPMSVNGHEVDKTDGKFTADKKTKTKFMAGAPRERSCLAIVVGNRNTICIKLADLPRR